MTGYSLKQNKKLKKFISWATLLFYLGQPIFVAAQAVADSQAPANNKPTIETTANGLPLVQIATPSAVGVSRNLYQQFDVGQRGLILNNANAVTNTQLAGYIYGNPNLTNGLARIILNEVTGSGISRLNGFLEVAGQKAQVVIANPNGIAVNGFGFINTSRGVLTTGTPIFGGSGSLDAFRVTGGQISVQGAGLDAAETDRAELISRTVSANAGIWAKDLSVITGRNKVDYETLHTGKIAQQDEGTTIALDVGALGGMYANKIKLIGTEKGVGVNSQGTIAASGGDLTLTNEGKVILAGNTSAAGSVVLQTSDSLVTQGTVYAQGNTGITAAGTLTNTGVLAAGQDTAINAQRIVSAGTLGAGIKSDGSLGSTGNLTLTSKGAIIAQGQTLAGGNLKESGTSIDHSSAVTYAGGNAAVTATNGDVNNAGGSIEIKGMLNLTAAGTLSNDKATGGKAGQISADNVKLIAHNLSNQGGAIIQTGTEETDITVSGNLDNTGGSLATNGAFFTIKASTIDNIGGQIQHAGVGELTLAAAGTLKNNTGSIISNGQVTATAQNLDNTQGTITAKQQVTVQGNVLTSVQGTISGDAINIKAQGSIDNRQGTIEGAKGLELAAQALVNDNGRITNLSGSDTKIITQQEIKNQAGLIGGNGNVLIAGKSIANQGGKLTAQGKLTITAPEGIDNTDGTIASGQDSELSLMGGNLMNTGGTVSTGGNLSIQALEVANLKGSLLANQDIHLMADRLSGNGHMLAGNDVAITLSGDLLNDTGGEIKANRNVNITVNGTMTNQGNITGVQAVTISGNNLANETDAVLLAGQNVTVSATGELNNQGHMEGSTVGLDGENIGNSGTVSADELTLRAGNIANSTSTAMLNSTKDITLETTASNGSITNRGTVYAQGKTTVNTAGTVENTGTVAAGQDTNIAAAAVHSIGTLAAGINSDGSLGNTGNLTIIAGKTITAQGKNLAGGYLMEQGASLDHHGAITYAGNKATLTATGGDIYNDGGVLQAGGPIILTAEGTIHNDKDSNGTAGQIAGDHIGLAAKNISNQGGTIIQTGTEETDITAGENLDNTGGTMATNGAALVIKAGSLNNTEGKIRQAGTGSLEVVTGGNLANQQGLLTTNGQLTLTAGELNNTGGTINANKAVTLSSSNLNNDKGTLITHDNITLTVRNGVSNRQGVVEAGEQFMLSAADIANQGGSMTSLDISGFTVTAGGTIDNTSGILGGNGDVGLTALALTNTSGKIVSGRSLTGVIANTLDNFDGSITAGQDITLGQAVPLGTLRNGAQGGISAGGNLFINAKDVDNQGDLLANQDITVAAGSIDAGGTAIAGRDLTLTAGGTFTEQAGGDYAANRNATITADTFTSQGSIVAVQNLSLAANSITNDSGAKIAGGQTLTIDGKKVVNKGILSGSRLVTTGKEFDNNGLVVANTLKITADTLSNSGSQASITINQAADFAIADTIRNTDGALLYNAAKQALVLNTHNLTNSGSILSGGATNITAQEVNSTGAIGAGINPDGTLGTAGDLTITSLGKLIGTGRNLAAHNLSMSGQTIDLSGAKTAAGNDITLTATAGDINNSGAVLQSNGTLDLRTTGKLSNDNAGIQAKQVNLTIGTLSNTNGKILQTGTGDTVIKTAVINNTGGTIATNGNSLTLEADTLTNKQGSIIHAGTGGFHVAAQAAVDNTQGVMRGNGTVDIKAATLDNTRGTIAGQQGLQVTGSGLTNDQGAMVTNGALSVNVQNTVNNRQGILEAGKALTVSAKEIANQNGSMTSLDNSGLSLNVSQTVDNTAGTLGANGDITVTAASLGNQGGKVLSQGSIYADVSQTIDNTAGRITADRDVTLGRNAAVSSVSNVGQGSMTAGANLLVKAIAFDNTDGSLAANRDIDYTVNNLNGAGAITAGQDLNFSLAGDFTYDNGSNLLANRDLKLTVANFTNKGTLSVVRNVTVSANNVTNGLGANLQGGAGLTIAAAGDVNNSGTLQSGNVDITGKNITNTGAVFGNTLTMTADTISNANNTAVIAATQEANLYAKTSLENKDDATIYSTGDIHIAGSKNKDGNGEYIDWTNSVLNQSATIEAEKDIGIYANTIINKKREFETEQKVVSNDTYITLSNRVGDTTSTGNDLFLGRKEYEITPETPIEIQVRNGYLPADSDTYIYSSEWETMETVAATFLLGQTVTETKIVKNSPEAKIISGSNMNLKTSGINNENSWILAGAALDSSGTINNVSTGNAHVTTQHLGYSIKFGDAWSVYRIYDEKTYESLLGGIALLGGGQQVNINAVNVNNITVTPGTVQTSTVNGLSSSGQATRADTVQNGGGSYTVGMQTSPGSTGIASRSVSAGGGQALSSSGQNTGTGAVQSDSNNMHNVNLQSSGTNITQDTGNTENLAQNVTIPVENMQTLLTVAKDTTASSVKQTSSNSITVPANAMYKTHTEPEAKYLVETDARFTSYGNFISSDYMLQKLNLDPTKVEKRLGDGFYEEKLVRDQVTELTGRYTLSGYSSAEEQYKALLNNGATYAQEFNLQVGVALSAEQMAQLTSDIVWMVEKEVNGQKVLVPQVYLAKTHVLQDDGALIVADNVQINASGNVTNAGSIAGNNGVQITAANIANYGGTIDSENLVKLDAGQDLFNFSGVISGKEVGLTAGQDLKNETVSITSTLPFMISTVTGKVADINAEQNLTIQVGQNTSIAGATLSAGQNISIITGNDFMIDSVKTQKLTGSESSYSKDKVNNVISSITAGQDIVLQSGRDTSIFGANLNAGKDISIVTGENLTVDSVQNREKTVNGSYLDDKVTNVVASINAGKDIALVANLDATLKGAQVKAGNDLSLVAGNVDVSAVKDESLHDETVSIHHGWKRTQTDDETVVAANLQGGGNVTVAAVQIPGSTSKDSGNVTIAGSNVISEKGNVAITADKDVTVQEVTEKHESLEQTHTKKHGFLSSKTKDTRDYTLINAVEGSTVSGDSVAITAGNDINVKAGNVVGTNDVNLTAKNDVNIVSAKETGKADHYSKTKKSGLFSGGGLGFTIGSKSETSDLKEQTIDEIGSTVGSINGNVNINAGNNVSSAGTTFVSGKDLNITGKEVSIDNTINTYDSQYKYEMKQSGLTVSLGGGVITPATNAASDIRRVGDVEDNRLKTLYDYKAIQDIKDIGKQVTDNNGNLKTGVTIGVSIGSSKSTTEQTVHTETVNVSNINAGGNVNVKATTGDVNFTGTKINANDITIEAVKNINIAGAQNKQQIDTKTSSSSGAVGVSIGLSTKDVLGGFGDYSSSKGKENENAAANVGSVINASGTTALKSGEDTNIIGSQVKGDKVIADVGGNLNIASKQDTNNYTSNTSSSGIGFGTDKIGGTTGSINKGKIDSTYASVTEQAGIYAGNQGFDINVGKNTDLNGAVIASTAAPDKNKLSTDTLTYSNIQNKAEYSASSSGVNYNTGKDKDGKNVETKDKGLTPNPGMPASGDASSKTQSSIANGTIEVRSGNTDVSKLSRNTDQALNSLGQIFDKKTVQERQELASVFGEIAYKAIGELANAQLKKAVEDENKAIKSGDKDAYDDAKRRESLWSEGGSNKIALHALVGGIMSNLGGNNFASGAVGAGVNETVQKELSKLKDQPDVWQWASAIVGSAATAAVGGDAQAGASTAASGTKNNELSDIILHPITTGEGFIDGVKSQGIQAAESFKEIIEHPIDTITGIGNFLADVWNDPSLVAAIGMDTLQEYQDRLDTLANGSAYETGEQLGYLSVDLGLTLLDLGLAEKLIQKAPNFSKAIEALNNERGSLRLGGSININKVSDGYLKNMGVDAHSLKEQFVGKKNIAHYDLYVDKDTGELLIYLKGGKGEGLPTGEYIK